MPSSKLILVIVSCNWTRKFTLWQLM